MLGTDRKQEIINEYKRHEGDTGCAIRAAVEDGSLDERRVQSFLKLVKEQARNSETLFERRHRDKSMGRFYKRVLADKKKMKDLR